MKQYIERRGDFVANLPQPTPINKIMELEDIETGERRRVMVFSPSKMKTKHL